MPPVARTGLALVPPARRNTSGRAVLADDHAGEAVRAAARGTGRTWERLGEPAIDAGDADGNLEARCDAEKGALEAMRARRDNCLRRSSRAGTDRLRLPRRRRAPARSRRRGDTARPQRRCPPADTARGAPRSSDAPGTNSQSGRFRAPPLVPELPSPARPPALPSPPSPPKPPSPGAPPAGPPAPSGAPPALRPPSPVVPPLALPPAEVPAVVGGHASTSSGTQSTTPHNGLYGDSPPAPPLSGGVTSMVASPVSGRSMAPVPPEAPGGPSASLEAQAWTTIATQKAAKRPTENSRERDFFHDKRPDKRKRTDVFNLAVVALVRTRGDWNALHGLVRSRSRSKSETRTRESPGRRPPAGRSKWSLRR